MTAIVKPLITISTCDDFYSIYMGVIKTLKNTGLCTAPVDENILINFSYKSENIKEKHDNLSDMIDVFFINEPNKYAVAKLLLLKIYNLM